MPKSINRIELAGHVGQAPEITETKNSTRIAKFSMATNYSTKNKVTNEWDTVSQWHNIVAFGYNVDTCDKIQKGEYVYLTGRLDHQAYEKDGVKKYFTSILADSIIRMTAKKTDATAEPETPESAPEPENTMPDEPQEIPF